MSKLDLRSFQKELSERLAAVRRAGGEAPRLTFSVADVSYALPLSEVTEVDQRAGRCSRLVAHWCAVAWGIGKNIQCIPGASFRRHVLKIACRISSR
jgi:hypothetical protein